MTNEPHDPQEERPGAVIPSRDQQTSQAFGELGEVLGLDRQVVACNFPDDPWERYTLMSMATDGEAAPIADMVNQEFDLKWWFIHNVALTDPSTGEVEKAPRVVLISPEGYAVYGVSTGLMKALQLLVKAMGPDEFKVPIRVKFTQSKTRQGWRFLSFQPVRKR